MKKIVFSALILAAAVTGLKAQQDPAYSMYMFNGLFINPAYAGSQEVVSMMGIFRYQWVGIEGAPKTVNVSVHSPLRQDQYALGLVLSNDKIGLSNTFNVTPSFAYRLRIKQSRLCFGAQVSLAYYHQNNGDAQTADPNTSDPSFLTNQNLFVPNFGFGIYAYGKRYFIGISAPHLLPSSLKNKTGVISNSDLVAKMYNMYVFNAGYVFGRDAAIVKFRPTILIKWQKGLPYNAPQVDISPALLFLDRFWLGVTYRTGGDVSYYGQSIIVFAQVKITPQLQLGYAYDAELTSLRHYTSGSHEIMLGYDFWYDKKRFVTPRFIKYF
ncbi:MAG TPA: type IX secretion system membrane protein PorP/SprF [Chitinophagales bacterium]|nr:type IX secretion system membrane protein PorP/SprF [Chitinophagales bacterium]